MTEREIGRSVAVLVLHATAEKLQRQTEAEERGEERRRRAEAAEQRRLRRHQVSARLGASLRTEAWMVLGWTVLWFAALIVSSLALTFAQNNADVGEALEAAWPYLWRPLLISAGAAWAAGLVYDVAAAARGGASWSSNLLMIHPLMGAGVPVILVGAAVESGYVPPDFWSFVPYASAAGFVASLIARFLWFHLPGRAAGQFAAVALCVAVGGVAWAAASADFLPSNEEEARASKRLRRLAPLGNCAGVPLKRLPPGLLRDSIDAMVRCHSGGKTGKFFAFSSPTLFNVFVSQREAASDSREEGNSAERCPRWAGAYSSDWWKEPNTDNYLGRLYCWGSGSAATVEWSDKRSDIYFSVRGQGRRHLYRWWRFHV